MNTGRIAMTRPGSGSSHGLAHLLWWDASVRAVLVERDGHDCTDARYEAYVDQVRRTIELTGSDAALLVSARVMLT